jgi:hypothetical protein
MTQTAQHTPGPWEINDNGLIYGQCREGDDEAPCVADVIKDRELAAFGIMSPEETANARLIAAAPELLFALEALIEYAQDTMPQELDGSLDVWTQAQAAVAKARG